MKQQKTFIIAEMAWSHDGSVDKAKTIMKGAADAGADAISLHLTDMPTYMVKRYGASAGQTLSAGREEVSVYDYLNKINLKENDWRILFPYAKKLGLNVCVMPNDKNSLKLASKLKADMYVIASACFVEQDFVRLVAKERKPVILRIGGATLGEIEKTVNTLKEEGVTDITLLHGIQLYPTRFSDTHVRLIPTLAKTFGLPVGIAEHIDAEDPLALVIPLLALPLGTTMIEKHITHDRSLKGEDIEAALNPDEFKTFVHSVRAAEEALGSSSFRPLSEGEQKYRNVSRKKTVAASSLKKGDVIKKSHLAFKRSDSGIPADESPYLVGKKVTRAVKKDQGITWEDTL